MKALDELYKRLAVERPVGSTANNTLLDLLESEATDLGYKVIALPFDCMYWNRGESFIKSGEQVQKVNASPFSPPFHGEGSLEVIRTKDELRVFQGKDQILLLTGEIAQEPLMPKDFPFYYPDEHREIIELLEEKSPPAIIAATGKHPMCGLNPYPLFEDGHFSIPSVYINERTAEAILTQNQAFELKIDSSAVSRTSRQLIASRKAAGESLGKIIVCAHMDSKYQTSGALDNAVGVAVMFELMDNLKEDTLPYDIDFVPFNSEEYYEVKGQLGYLNDVTPDWEHIKLVINIDSPCYLDSKTAVSSYNLDEQLQKKLDKAMLKDDLVKPGPQWYAGDHSMFAYRQVPCLAVTTLNLLDEALKIVHTENDTVDYVNLGHIKPTAAFLADLIRSL